MRDNLEKILSGTHKFTGSEACAEGALSAGCGFLSAYPIVPSIEILERFSKRFSDFGAV